MGALGQSIQSQGSPPTDAQLDQIIADVQKAYQAYDTYAAQQAATLHAAGEYMRSVYFTTDAKVEVLNAINALPVHPFGLLGNNVEYLTLNTALNDFANGASVLVGQANKVVRGAEIAHTTAEVALFAGGVASLGATTLAAYAADGANVAAGKLISAVEPGLPERAGETTARRLADRPPAELDGAGERADGSGRRETGGI